MAIRLSAASRNAAVDAIAARPNAGGAGVIEIRSGAQPATADDAATGTLLATIPLAATAYGAAANGTAALAGTPRQATGLAAGTAGWFRVKSGGGATVFDGSVGTAGADLLLNTTTVSVGVAVEVTALPIVMPAS